MNIYARSGQRVRYLGQNGYDSQRERIEALGVKAGDILTVDYTDVGSWCTYVAFADISGEHNSVMFEDYEEPVEALPPCDCCADIREAEAAWAWADPLNMDGA